MTASATASVPRPARRTRAAPPPPSGADRRATGRAARLRAPRTSHGEWSPRGERPDPVAVLAEQDTTRVPELVPLRYERMLVSPFTFFRGAAALMAGDLAGTPDSGLTVQLCGDAHLSNFGVFTAPDRRLVFDLNDFDETHPGPWEWDVKRLAASLEIAGRDRGFRRRERREVVAACVCEYRETMRRFATMRSLDVWYARMDVEDFLQQQTGIVRARDLRAARTNIAKAKAKDSLRAVAKLTERVNGSVRFASAPPLLTPVGELLPDTDADALRTEMRALLNGYRRSLSPERRHLIGTYRYVDLARKVVGVGSVGTRAWVILLEGRDAGDPLVLQAKEAGASVLDPYLAPSRYKHHGERVVRGQRFMQAASDDFLGWERVIGIDGTSRDFYLRQLWDGKGSAIVEAMDVSRMLAYGRLCGWTLARAHARSGDRVAIAAYLGAGSVFDDAIAGFAAAYADQNDLDYVALRRAVGDGRVATGAA